MILQNIDLGFNLFSWVDIFVMESKKIVYIMDYALLMGTIF